MPAVSCGVTDSYDNTRSQEDEVALKQVNLQFS
jgi:hypothetical protein